MAIKKEIILAYALKNAVEHNGFAQSGPIISGLFNHGLKKSGIKKIMPEINSIIEHVNSLKPNEQTILFEKHKDIIGHRSERQGLPEIPNTNKPLVMRFAPSPSGPLHIGHALTSSLSYLYVKEFGGEFYIRIEDTNPENIYKPAYKMIEKESKWLFENNCKIIIQSNNLEIYYKYAEKLIKKNSAYVCTCEPEKFKELLLKTKPCPCRNLSIKEQMQRWKRMLDKNVNSTGRDNLRVSGQDNLRAGGQDLFRAGGRDSSSKSLSQPFKPGQAVLRFKSNLKDKNPAMRDFPLARINTTPHPLQKNKYRVWPLMNLSVTVDDIEEKMTHIIRAKEHRDNAKRQEMIYKALGKEKQIPWTSFLGRIHFTDFTLSASQIRKDIEAGKYSGWDDLRLPTLASLKKQGYKPQAFHKFAEQIGLNENDKKLDKKEFFLILNNFNKK